MEKNNLWQEALGRIQLRVSKANFITWFKNTWIYSFDKNQKEITIATPNSFSKEWLEHKYSKIILEILRELNKEIKKINFIVASKKSSSKKEEEIKIEKKQPLDQLSLQEFKTIQETNLNPRYTFENFVVGSFNEIPHAAALAVCEKPGTAYNPLFIYGGVGLGKTHLLQAIGNRIISIYKKKRVRYLPAEKLTSEIISAIRNQTINQLKKDYQNIDILIIDDIQFLSGKEKTQEEFFHLFNSLYERNKQIVLSSDRLPKSIPYLERRLRSRFEGGMIADIGVPDYETRVAILKTKAKEKNVSFPDDVYEFIAENIKTNIRELEGALNRIILHQKVNKNKKIGLPFVKEVLKKILTNPKNIITPKRVIRAVADFYDIPERALLENSRKKELVKPRQVAMYLLREDLKESFPTIGRRFGGKDHTTVIYAVEKVSKEIKENERLKGEIELIRERINSA